MDAFKAGTWRPPTATDAQLARGLGGSNMVISVNDSHKFVPTKQEPPSQMQVPSQVSAPLPFIAPALQQQSGVVATVTPRETIQQTQFSLDDYLRSFHSGASTASSGLDSNIPPAGFAVNSSDQFLRGILGGDWTSYTPPPTTYASPPIAASYDPPSFWGGSGTYGQAGTMNSDIHDSLFGMPGSAPSPYSDGGSSTRSAPGVGVAGYAPGPPAQLVPMANSSHEQMNMFTDAYSTEQQAAFLWDNILRELDIPNQGP